MPTKFIAVQCFQCLMMQVKQSKKSSNTWICVVCNQKQSMLHVFAEGYLAKDVRQFVQNFNMSRQPKLLHPNKEVEEQDLEIERISVVEDKPKKRTDWTEYLQYDEEDCRGRFYEHECGKDAGEIGFDETLVVTEKPKVLPKKLKSKDYSVGMEADEHLLKPVFPFRSDNKRNKNAQGKDMKRTKGVCSDEELIISHSGIKNSVRKTFTLKKGDDKLTNKAGRTELSDCIAPGECKHLAKGAQTVQKTVANLPVSKWTSYISEEDDHDLQVRDGRDSKFCIHTQMIRGSFEPLVNDIKVEDEVHIDFIKDPESACL